MYSEICEAWRSYWYLTYASEWSYVRSCLHISSVGLLKEWCVMQKKFRSMYFIQIPLLFRISKDWLNKILDLGSNFVLKSYDGAIRQLLKIMHIFHMTKAFLRESTFHKLPLKRPHRMSISFILEKSIYLFAWNVISISEYVPTKKRLDKEDRRIRIHVRHALRRG